MVNVGGYQELRARSGLRSAVNARLEEISFRTGLIAATIALVALSAIVAAGVYVAALGGQGSVTRAPSAVKPPVKTVSAPASARPRPASHAQASPKPKAQRPVTADATSSQPAAGTGSQAQAGSSVQAGSSASASTQAPARGNGHAGPYGHGPSSGGHDPYHGGFGVPGRGPGGPGPGRIGGTGGLRF